MQNQNYILWDVTLIDGTGAEPQHHMAVAIRDKNIEWVLETRNAKCGGFEVLDLSGMTVMPGLIDAHVHLSGVAGDRVSAFTIHPLVRAYKSAVQAQEIMSYGVTAVRDISPLGLYLKRLIHCGELTGPRIIACGQGLTRSGGHADIPELPFEIVDNPHSWESRHYWGVFADGETEIRKQIRLMLREGADQIKFWASGGGYSTVDLTDDVHYTLNECKIIVDEASLICNMPVLAHAEGLKSIEYCIEAGVNSIEHGDDLDERCAELMAKKDIILVPTINLVANWYFDRFSDERVESTPIGAKYGPIRMVEEMLKTGRKIDGNMLRDRSYEMLRMAYEKGVKIAMGSDTVRDLTTPYGEYSIRELLAMIEAGIPVLEAIRASTQVAAEALRLDRFLGTVEMGKRADLLVLRVNPAEAPESLLNRKNLHLIIQDGHKKIEDGRMSRFGEKWE